MVGRGNAFIENIKNAHPRAPRAKVKVEVKDEDETEPKVKPEPVFDTLEDALKKAFKCTKCIE